MKYFRLICFLILLSVACGYGPVGLAVGTLAVSAIGEELNRRRVRGTRKMIGEFERSFPGRCPICSYHRYRRRHGYGKSQRPDPHSCPEVKPETTQ